MVVTNSPNCQFSTEGSSKKKCFGAYFITFFFFVLFSSFYYPFKYRHVISPDEKRPAGLKVIIGRWQQKKKKKKKFWTVQHQNRLKPRNEEGYLFYFKMKFRLININWRWWRKKKKQSRVEQSEYILNRFLNVLKGYVHVTHKPH